LLFLYLLYSAPLHTVYYFADESAYLTEDHNYSSPKEFFNRSLRLGRPITLFAYWMMDRLVHQQPNGLQLIRFFQFLASYASGLFFFYLLRRMNLSPGKSFFLVLFIWSQPALQCFHVYCMLSPYFLGVCSSYFAFLLICKFTLPGSFLNSLNFIIAVVLLLIASLIFQASPFCGLAPLAFYVLSATHENWIQIRKKSILFIIAVVVSMTTFTVGYKLLVEVSGVSVAMNSEHTLELLKGLSIVKYRPLFDFTNYLGPFEWWNYLYPVPNLSSWLFLFSTLCCLIWLTAFLCAFYFEGRTANQSFVIQKYFIVLASIALSFLPVIADRFSGREHVYIACSPALFLVFFYAASQCAQYLFPNKNVRSSIKFVAVLFIVLVAAGAQANVYRGVVLPNAKLYSFVKSEIIRQLSPEISRILVINAQRTCLREPCRGFMARRASLAVRTGEYTARFYREVLVKCGGKENVPVDFADQIERGLDPQKTIVIDHRIFLRSLF
jgi:hypothetical protein